ncbi:MAG: alpha/beta hydrolase, partial [Acholeplasmataceae bacterium]
MSILKFKNYNIYYEVNGIGEPILILNGIMMSTKSWEPFVNSLSKHSQLIRVDFLDQGQSSRMSESYTQSIQVEVVLALLDHLKIAKINLVGISYGGEVSVLFASMHPNRVKRLLLFNTTAYTSPWLAELGHQWNSIGRLRDGKLYYQATIPVIYS